MAINLDVHGNTAPLEAQVQAAVNRIRKIPVKLTIDEKGATQPLGNMKRGADEFTKSMEAANARILAFGASMAIINGVADAFKGMVRNMVEVEKSLADINVVMGLSAKNLDQFSDGLFKVAKETGQAFRVAADAATEYARQGLSVEESLKRTRDALILTRLTGMDSAEAVKALTAAMNTYGSQIKDTTQLVSKFAAVDVQFAVSAEDFADAIARTGQAAKSAGVDIDELIGIVTAAQQQTARGGKVIGNSLKTIFTRVGRTDTLNQLENLGIAVRDLEGNTLGAKRILTDLANTFDKLNEAQKAQIAQTVGGVFQINILKAILSDAAKQNGILANATQISAGATDEAIEKNEQLRKTMSAMATETGLAIKEASVRIGEIALAPGMEKILNTVKSIAEGINTMFGDGESAANKFATGFLKGIGNIITGPGLVVLTSVFFKLFGQAFKFTRDSLSSLIGITSEAQKQKAIQTSLVDLMGRNANLNKELLRTDIGRTEKEKIILGYLKAQVAEANVLNNISKQLASTLHAKGYGANLTPLRGRGRAGGHIPNFAHPERMQAAKGGYAAGSIRSMNMPGEGSIIYNSAETVKNFAGFKQPAIMPPQSSKAGKNYQQAFGSIHGFDPYAARGYIPNFALKMPFKRSKYSEKTEDLTIEEAFARGNIHGNTIKAAFGDEAYKKALNKGKTTVGRSSGLSKTSLAAMLVPPEGYGGPKSSYGTGANKMSWSVYSLKPDAKIDPDLSTRVKNGFKNIGSKYASSVSGIIGGNQVSPGEFWNAVEADTAGGAKGAWKAAVGAIFEAAINAALDYQASKRHVDQGDFDVRGGKLSRLRKVFDGFPASMNLADYKSDSFSDKNRKSFRDKVLKEKKYIEQKARGKKGLSKAYGFIPNFADPLSDAIGREKAAGVPVSQIRVGSHNALMSKGNPLGLGVTNTKDEPNGLRDVFGANGFVPNYATIKDFRATDFEGVSNEDRKKIARQVREKIKNGDLNIKSEKQLNKFLADLNPKVKLNAKGLEKSNQLIQQNNAARGGLRSRITGGLKNMGSGMGGMGLMMGLPMLAGFIPGADKPGSAGGIASGIMSGAATGAALGMMFPGFGTAIGAAVGALGGFINGLDNAEKAVNAKAAEDKKAAKAVQQAKTAEFVSAISSAFTVDPNQKVANLNEIFKSTGSQNIIGALRDKVAPQTKLANQFIGQSYFNLFQDLSAKNGVVGSNQMLQYEAENKILKTVQAQGPNSIERKIEKQYKEVPTEEIQNEKHRALVESARKKMGGQTLGRQLESTIKDNPVSIPTATALAKRDLLSSMFSAKPGETFISESFKEIFGDAEISSEDIVKFLGSGDVGEADKRDKINLLFDLIYKDMIDQKKAQSQYTQGVISQLDMQMASLQAQEKLNKNLYDINSRYAEYGRKLSFQKNVMGDFMSAEQKIRLRESQSLLEADKKYELSLEENRGSARGKIINELKKDVYDQALKSGGYSAEKIGTMSLEDLRELAENLAGETQQHQAIRKLIRASTKEMRNKNKQAERSLILSEEDAKARREEEEALLRQRRGPDAFKYGFAAEQTKMRESAAELDHQLGGIVAVNFRNGLVSAMDAALDRSKDLGDVLQNVAMGFMQAIQSALLTAAANQMVGAIGINLPIGQSRGGNIRNYSRGGSIPAMVTNGEYVMNKRAVSKYGSAFMHKLNASGKIPGFSNGGSMGLAEAFGQPQTLTDFFNQPIQPSATKAASVATSPSLADFFSKPIVSSTGQASSGAFKLDTKSSQGLSQAFSKQIGLSESSSIAQNAAPQAGFFGKFFSGLFDMLLTPFKAIGSLIPGFSNGGMAGSALAANFGGAGNEGVNSGRRYQSMPMSGFFYSGQAGNVGLDEDIASMQGVLQERKRKEMERFQKKAKRRALLHQIVSTVASAGIAYASGAFGQSGVEGTGGVPAGTEGNVPIAPGSTNYYGGNIRKYASGGHISGKPGIDQIPAMLSEGEYVIRASSARQIGKPLLDKINAGKFYDGGETSTISESSEQSSSAGSTNNINISINMSGKTQTESQEQDSQGAKEGDNEKAKALSDRIKKQVLSVIVEEQRPGGLLQDTK
jgi:TP901 family phage tail tape measure protein